MSHLVREVKLDMCGAALHRIQDLRGGSAGDGMDLLYLVHLIGAGEQGEQTDNLRQARQQVRQSHASCLLTRQYGC